ncbi:hypothetical protein LINPERHAP2_LOCUS13754, partial [Linum perenne]
QFGAFWDIYWRSCWSGGAGCLGKGWSAVDIEGDALEVLVKVTNQDNSCQ